MLLIGEDRTEDGVGHRVRVGNDMKEIERRLESTLGHLLKDKPHEV